MKIFRSLPRLSGFDNRISMKRAIDVWIPFPCKPDIFDGCPLNQLTCDTVFCPNVYRASDFADVISFYVLQSCVCMKHLNLAESVWS